MRVGNGVSAMSGYRDRSNYDPYSNPRYGRPLRPFNWVQWCGVVIAVVGIAFELAYLAAQSRWVGKFADSPMIGSSLVLLSIPLINSRREELTDLAPELASQRRRMLLMSTLVIVVILGAATIVEIARS